MVMTRSPRQGFSSRPSTKNRRSRSLRSPPTSNLSLGWLNFGGLRGESRHNGLDGHKLDIFDKLGAWRAQGDSVDAETVIAEQGRIALSQAKLKLP